MKIIDDNKAFIESIEWYVKYNPLPSEADGYTFVNASLVANFGDKRTDRKGITEAHNLVRKGEKVVVYSFENPQHLYSEKNSLHKEFMKVMSQQSSLFLQLPNLFDEFQAEIAEPKYHNLAMDLASTASISTNVAGSLLHSMDRTGIPKTAELGRHDLSLEGSDDEVIEQLKTLRRQKNMIRYDKVIPGLFVDIEGTLFYENKLINSAPKLNNSVLEKIIAYKGPVTLWTGGNLNDLQYKVGIVLDVECKKHNSRLYTRTTTLSKHDFRGCKVESVLDDSSQDKFIENYDITAQNYEQVK